MAALFSGFKFPRRNAGGVRRLAPVPSYSGTGSPAVCWAMGGLGKFTGRGDEGDLSWTNEELPLDVRRELLDKALEDFRAAKAAGSGRRLKAATPDRPGQAGAGADSSSAKDKPST
jgi:hypothetical protein